MKRTILASLLSLAMTTALAGPYIQLAHSWGENRSTDATSVSSDITLGTKVGSWQYSGMAQMSQTSWGDGPITNSIEGRLRYNFNPVAFGLKPWTQLRLGDQITSDNEFLYYALDIGMTVPLDKKFELDFGYRYRNAFDTSNEFQTDRAGVEGKLKFTDTDTLGLRYGQSYGDSETDSVRIQYSKAF